MLVGLLGILKAAPHTCRWPAYPQERLSFMMEVRRQVLVTRALRPERAD